MLLLISIIIPTYNEAGNIGELLDELCSELTGVAGVGSDLENRVKNGIENGIEIIVVDGGSSDRTPAIVSNYTDLYPVQLIISSPGRAAQMNQGAKAAQGEILLFLHADSRLPKGFVGLVNQVFKESPSLQPNIKPNIKPDINPYIAGAFELEITGDLPGLRLVEKLVNCRSHLLQLPYGDQAIFLKAATFEKLGGFPDLPIMEDFQLIRQLQKLGKIAIVPTPVKTSPRRWQKLGVWQTTMINQLVILAFFLGIPPEKIARFYRRKK